MLAANAAKVVELGAPAIDLNFGCPAKTVNSHRGGSVLLTEPETVYQIIHAVRQAVPTDTPVSAKIRLGYEDTSLTTEIGDAVQSANASWLTIHARTKTQGYKPPAYWELIEPLTQRLTLPIIANGEIWSVDDWRRCREISGAEDIMLGRGLVSRPDLARQIAAARAGDEVVPMRWDELLPLLQDFWQQARRKLAPRYAPGRLKQWLAMLTRSYPEAVALFAEIRRENDCARIDALLKPLQPAS